MYYTKQKAKNLQNKRMTKVTKENMETYLMLRKKYQELKGKGFSKNTNEEMAIIFDVCDTYIQEVINKDKKYYTKLESYHFSNDDLLYCM